MPSQISPRTKKETLQFLREAVKAVKEDKVSVLLLAYLKPEDPVGATSATRVVGDLNAGALYAALGSAVYKVLQEQTALWNEKHAKSN